MSSIQDLEQKIRQLEQLIIKQQEDTKAVLDKSNRALDEAIHAYRIDHAGYVWVWDPEQNHYRKTDVCVRVIIPKVKPKEITNCKIGDKAVNNRTLDDNSVDNRVLATNAVGTENIKDKAVTPSKLNDKVITEVIDPRILNLDKQLRRILEDMQNQIDSFNDFAVSVSNYFGDNPHIGVSQATLTKAVNDIWAKLEDITGEVLKGISMAVSPKYYIGEDGCHVHITASTSNACGIFEKIRFEKWGEGDTAWTPIGQEAENVDRIELDTEIDSTTDIRCTAQILGMPYVKTRTITHYPSLFLGAGDSYEDMMFNGQFNPEYAIPTKNHMRGAYDVTAEEGAHIIIAVGSALQDDFIRADINGIEIEFTSELVPVDSKYFKVFTSVNTYQAGVINVDING